jgi:hypothetical protein
MKTATIFFINPDLMRHALFIDAFYSRGEGDDVSALATKELVTPENYTAVAELPMGESNSVNGLFARTQNMEVFWTQHAANEGITFKQDGRVRSSMVGDVFMVNEPGKPSEAYAVLSMGLRKLPPEITNDLFKALW